LDNPLNILVISLFGGNEREVILFGIFGAIIILFLVLDLGLFHKQAHKVSTKSALYQSIFWVTVSALFGYFIYVYDESGAVGAVEYFSAYLTEKALSVDNIFVILLILKYFQVDETYYHKILFWGILGAIIMRAIFIFCGRLPDS
jgi:Membrane protein TerC, possibly involved in tellurium resistance